jgi:predicted dehydrogenase
MPTQLSRREAIQTAAGAAAAAGLWLGAGTSTSAASSPNEKLNIACIGIGGRGAANLGGVSSQNIVALCDVDEKRAGGGFTKFPKARRFQDYRRMFDAMDKNIDAVVVSTPDHTHFHPAITAMQMGKHLYCEKPMAHSVWEIREMTRMAKKMKIATQLGAQRHTLTNMHRSVELVQAGVIGKVSDVHSWIGGERGMPGAAKTGESVPKHLNWDLWLGPAADRAYSSSYCPYNWRFWWDFGTGETGNWGCHILDIPFWALGLKYPTRVDASGPEVHPQQASKAMATHLSFPDQGVTLHWYHAKSGPPVLKEKGLSGKGMNTLFIGSKGMLLTGFGGHVLLPDDKFEGLKRPDQTIPRSPGFYNEWFTACKGGAPATCDFDYSGPLSETVLLANTAYRGGGFDWNSDTLSTGGNKKAAGLIRTEYRKGWEPPT